MRPATHAFLHDNLWHLLRRQAVPGILGMLIVSINSLVDAVFVGRWVGPDALAGLVLVFPLTVINSSLVALLSAGFSSVASRSLGADDPARQRDLLNLLLTLSLVLGGTVSLLGYGFARQAVALLGGTGAVLRYGAAYYEILALGGFFTLLSLSSSTLIRATGQIRQAMTYSATAVITNMVLAATFVKGLHMGVRGAALGTGLAMLLYCVLNLQHLLRGRTALALGPVRPYFNWPLTREIVGIGSSAFLMQATSFVRQVLIFKSVAHYGTAAELAFFGAVYRVYGFSQLPVFGLLQALQPTVGINHGAGNYLRSQQAVRVFRLAGIGLLFLVSLPSLLFPAQVLDLLLPATTFATTDLAQFRMLMLVLLGTPLASTGYVYFQATGQARLATTLSFGREVLFVPLILLIPRFLGLPGIYYGLALENVTYALVVLGVTTWSFRRAEEPVLQAQGA
ncbi:MATE family efflux transporter [Hymenobacter cellulosilyticus]|uniref:MATE family efflux transporter n=1 Tax=Hymenobacter cellulosilyticus TaxID=2932248 RepID=A0A8T9PXR8_9BACT|nr:MATE family efflux transporter [Hymenobacter cellulosilyticus]UOQ70196.1 MATE family efflux transporter [Hymenobacter cellulosilyticus]